MKQRSKFRMIAMITIVFASLLICSSCNNNNDKKCCKGFTGKITDGRADSLQNRCHFLSKDSIEIWVSKYEEYKKTLDRNQGYNTNTNTSKDSITATQGSMSAELDKMAASFLRGGSVSYNNCIIKKILCHENSIGLRVLFGIGGDNKIHIILVGIKPDYSNLYVDAADDCCTQSMSKALGAGVSGLSATAGGAEYGQMP